MAEILNYMAPQIDLSRQFAGLNDALSLRRERVDAEREKQEAADRARQYAADLQAAMSDGSGRSFSALIAKYPDQAKALKSSWDVLEKAQKDDEFDTGIQAWSALRNGKADIAAGIIDQRIEAMKNQGADTRKLESVRAAIDLDPKSAANHVALVLSSVEPDKWSKIAGEMRAAELAPSKLTESQAKAQKAAVDAKFAESKAVLGLQKTGWDITKIQADIGIAQQNSRIAAMTAATARESNDIKREALTVKLDAAKAVRDQKVRDVSSNVASARGTVDNALNTIDGILKSPALPDVLGPVEGRAGYPSTVAGMLNPFSSSSDDRADALAKIDTLKSQIFLSKLADLKSGGPSGLGALSEKEGERLMNGLQSLMTTQSVKGFTGSLKEVQRLLLKSRENLKSRYGVPEVIPDTPNADPTPEEAEALLKKYGQ